MKRYLLFILFALCGATAAEAQNAQPAKDDAGGWHECFSVMPTAVTLTIEGQNPQVEYRHDVVYAEPDGRRLTLQVLCPRRLRPDAPSALPCVVFVQGSAWFKQNVYANLPAFARFAERGYVVAIVEYTHTGIAPFPAPLKDVKTAIRFMRKNAAEFGVDADKMFVWGDSSGGHLALMTAVTDGIEEFDTPLYRDVSTRVNACVSFYGVTELKSFHTDPCTWSNGLADSPEGRLIGGKDIDTHIAEADAASPAHYVSADRNIPPILLVVGTCDHIVPFSQTELMARKLHDACKPYEYYVIRGADHATWEFWTPQCFDLVDAFLRKHM